MAFEIKTRPSLEEQGLDESRIDKLGDIIKFDPNTGKRLGQGQSVNFEGKTFTQGGSFSAINSETLQPRAEIKLPKPQAQTSLVDSTDTLKAEATNARKALESSYAQQLKEANERAEALRKSNEEFNAITEGIIEKADPTQRATFEQEQRIKQNKLDAAEEASRTITENFNANQKITNELDSLLTEGNVIAKRLREQKIPGLAGIQQSGRATRALETIQARAGVLQAVMSARSGQQSAAYSIIDKATEAVNADKSEQLNYYNTLLNFSGTKKAEAEAGISLSKDQREILNRQIQLLEDDVKTTQDNAEKIKDIFQDPAKATLFAEAGITLTTPQSEWGPMLATAAYNKQKVKTSETMLEKGYSTLTPEEAQFKSPDEVLTYVDSRGNEQMFWKIPDEVKADIRAVGGGLYNITEQKWVVRGKEGGVVGGGSISAPIYTPGVDPTVDAYVKLVAEAEDPSIALTRVPKELQQGVARAYSQTTTPNAEMIVDSFDAKIDILDTLANHPGLNSRVGTSFLSRTPQGKGFWGTTGKIAAGAIKAPLTLGLGTIGDVSDKLSGAGRGFESLIKQLQNKETLDLLIKIRGMGATLGALSDREREMLQQGATQFGTWELKDENGVGLGVYDIDERRFKEELMTLKSLAQKARDAAAKKGNVNIGSVSLTPEDQSEIDILYEVEGELNPENYYE